MSEITEKSSNLCRFRRVQFRLVLASRWMIEKCDLTVCYVEREFGGAYTALKYAERLGKDIIHLDNSYEAK